MKYRGYRKTFFIIGLLLFFSQTAAMAKSAGGGFDYDETTIRQNVNFVFIEGVMRNNTNKTFERTHFIVLTFDASGVQNGFATFQITEFSSDQPRNFNVTVDLFDAQYVDRYNIEFKGGKRKE